MSAWLPEVLPVASALVGVAVANRGAARRDIVARLWERRVDTYLAVAEWARSVDSQVVDRDPEGEGYRDLPAEAYGPMQASEDLSTRVLAFASNRVVKEFIVCDDQLTFLAGGYVGMPPADKLEINPYRNSQLKLTAGVSRLTRELQEELRDGRLRVPVANPLRRQISRLGLMIRASRLYRKIKKPKITWETLP